MEDINDSTIVKLSSSDERKASYMPKDLKVLLLLVGNIGESKSYRLVKNPTIIGRGAEVDLRIPDECISRKHTRIEFADGKFHVADMNSTNGTYVNEAKVVEASIKSGDLLTLGDVKLKFIIEGTDPDDIRTKLVGIGEFVK